MFLRERQQIVILVAAALMASGFVLFRYLPLRREAKAVELSGTAQKTLIVQTLARKQQLPAMKEKLLELQEEVKNYERNIPVQTDLGEFLGKIAELMNQHNLSEQVIQPGEEIKAKQVNCIPVIMKCTGRLTQIRRFCESLQALDRSVRIEHFELVNDRDLSGLVGMETKAIIYYREKTGQD